MTTEKDPFLEMAKERMPLPTVLGAASSVVGEGAVPRPDRSYTVLMLLSIFGGIFGLDHFYLRNPYSGLLKGLTLGGFFIWWLWDIFQLWTEKDRVLLYGMSAPFDLKMGFGQGTIAEGKTHYEQRSDSALWILAALFSFVGADSLLLHNWGNMLRKMTEGIIFLMLLWSLSTTWNTQGLDGLLTFGNILRILMAIMVGHIVIKQWVNIAVPSLTDPVGMFKNGIRISPDESEIINFPQAWIKNITLFDNEGETTIQDITMKDVEYKSITGEEMKKKFEVHYVSPADKAEEAAAEDAAAKKVEAAKAGGVKWHWVLSYLVYLFGPFIWLFQIVYEAIMSVPPFKVWRMEARLAKKGFDAAAALASGKNPIDVIKGSLADVVGTIPGMPPGLAKAAKKAAKVASTVEKAKATASAAMETARGLTTNPLDAAAGVAGSMGTKLPTIPKGFKLKQEGGARHEEPSSQGMILGASVFALAGGAAIKLAVDYLLPQ